MTRRTPGLLLLVFLVDAAFATTFLVALQAYLPDALGARAAVAGYTLAAFGIAKLVVQSFGGMLSDRRSPGTATVTGIMLCLLASLGMAVAGRSALFPPLGALYGAGSAVLWPALYSLAAGSSEEGHRSRIAAALALTTGAAVGVAVLGGSFVSDFVGPRAALVGSFAALALATLIAPLFVRGLRPQPGNTPDATARVRRLEPGGLARGLVAALVLLQAAAIAGLVPIIGPFARRALGIQLHEAVLYLAPAGAFALAGLLAATRLADRTGQIPVLVVGLGLAATGALGLAVAPHVATAAAAACVMALGYGAAFPSIGATIMDYAGDQRRGTLIGWFMAAEGTGHAAGPALLGFITGAMNPQSAVLVSALLLALASGVAGGLLALVTGRRPAPALPAFPSSEPLETVPAGE